MADETVEPQLSSNSNRQVGGARLLAARMLVTGINEELESLLGSSAAKALNYRVDSAMAQYDPLRYEGELRDLLGPMSVKIVEHLRDRLCSIAGQAPKKECRGIEGCLDCIWRGAVSQAGPLGTLR